MSILLFSRAGRFVTSGAVMAALGATLVGCGPQATRQAPLDPKKAANQGQNTGDPAAGTNDGSRPPTDNTVSAEDLKKADEQAKLTEDEARIKAEKAKETAIANEEAKKRSDAAKVKADEAKKKAEETKTEADTKTAEEAANKAKEEATKAEAAQKKLEEEQKKAKDAQDRAVADRKAADDLKKKADDQKKAEAAKKTTEDKKAADKKAADVAVNKAIASKKAAEDAAKVADTSKKPEDIEKAKVLAKAAEDDKRAADAAVAKANGATPPASEPPTSDTGATKDEKKDEKKEEKKDEKKDEKSLGGSGYKPTGDKTAEKGDDEGNDDDGDDGEGEDSESFVVKNYDGILPVSFFGDSVRSSGDACIEFKCTDFYSSKILGGSAADSDEIEVTITTTIKDILGNNYAFTANRKEKKTAEIKTAADLCKLAETKLKTNPKHKPLFCSVPADKAKFDGFKADIEARLTSETSVKSTLSAKDALKNIIIIGVGDSKTQDPKFPNDPTKTVESTSAKYRKNNYAQIDFVAQSLRDAKAANLFVLNSFEGDLDTGEINDSLDTLNVTSEEGGLRVYLPNLQAAAWDDQSTDLKELGAYLYGNRSYWVNVSEQEAEKIAKDEAARTKVDRVEPIYLDLQPATYFVPFCSAEPAMDGTLFRNLARKNELPQTFLSGSIGAFYLGSDEVQDKVTPEGSCSPEYQNGAYRILSKVGFPVRPAHFVTNTGSVTTRYRVLRETKPGKFEVSASGLSGGGVIGLLAKINLKEFAPKLGGMIPMEEFESQMKDQAKRDAFAKQFEGKTVLYADLMSPQTAAILAAISTVTNRAAWLESQKAASKNLDLLDKFVLDVIDEGVPAQPVESAKVDTSEVKK